jgi:hypothetical protein
MGLIYFRTAIDMIYVSEQLSESLAVRIVRRAQRIPFFRESWLLTRGLNTPEGSAKGLKIDTLHNT